MLGNFVMNQNGTVKVLDNYASIKNDIRKCRDRLEAVKGELNGASYGEVKGVLSALVDTQNTFINSIKQLEEAMEKILHEYNKAEQKILGASVSYTPEELIEELEKENNQEVVVGKAIDFLKDMIDSSGSLGAQAKPYLEILFSHLLGEEVNPAVIAQFMLAAPAQQFAFFAQIAEEGWASAVKDGLGISKYFSEGVNASPGFWNYLKEAGKIAKRQEIDDLANFSTLKDGAKAVAKWAGYAVTAITNGVENYEEWQEGYISEERAVAETVIETGVDIALGTGATIAVAAGAAALGFVSAPALVVGGIAAGVVIGANWACEAFTGGKDIGECLADGLCNGAEAVGGWFKGLFSK